MPVRAVHTQTSPLWSIQLAHINIVHFVKIQVAVDGRTSIFNQGNQTQTERCLDPHQLFLYADVLGEITFPMITASLRHLTPQYMPHGEITN